MKVKAILEFASKDYKDEFGDNRSELLAQRLFEFFKFNLPYPINSSVRFSGNTNVSINYTKRGETEHVGMPKIKIEIIQNSSDQFIISYVVAHKGKINADQIITSGDSIKNQIYRLAKRVIQIYKR